MQKGIFILLCCLSLVGNVYAMDVDSKLKSEAQFEQESMGGIACNCQAGETPVGKWTLVRDNDTNEPKRCRMHYTCETVTLCDTYLGHPVPADPALAGLFGVLKAKKKECQDL